MCAAFLKANPRLLIVDDLDDDIFLLRHALKKGGVTSPIDSRENGSLAVEHLKSCLANLPGAVLPTLVLLDVKMPMMDGHQVLAWIRSQPALNNLAVYMFSSSPLPSDISRAEKSHAAGYWIKPGCTSEYDVIVAKIKTLLAP